MANLNAPFGMRPVYEGNGSPWAGTMTMYYRSTSDAHALYIGDPVILDGSGDANGIPSVILATAGTSARITGSVVGFLPSPALVANGATLPASTAGYVYVADGPGVTYAIEMSGALANTDLGGNTNLLSGTGNLIQGSGWQADSTVIGTQAAKQLRILSVVQDPNNVIGANAVVLVRINLPTEAGIASGTGF